MRLKILYFALILFGITFAQAHAQIAATRKGEDKNSARVARIMARALARCRSQVHGFSKISWVPPTNDDVQGIEAMGELAVVPLSRSVDSERKDGFSELIAVRLLAAIGGQIVEVPLR